MGRGAWLGRTLKPEDAPDGCAIAWVGAGFFVREFPDGAIVSANGAVSKLILNGTPCNIAGLTPADFHPPMLWQGREVAGRLASCAARSRAAHRGRVAPQRRVRTAARRFYRTGLIELAALTRPELSNMHTQKRPGRFHPGLLLLDCLTHSA
jgi:hypothetical protein